MTDLYMVDLYGTIPPRTLLSHGAVGAIGYSSRYRRKCPPKGYGAQLVALGGRYAIVFEDTARESLDGASAGHDNGNFAVGDAKAQGYPKGCTIFASADFDAHPDQIRAYVQAFSSVARRAGYEMGLYANGLCIRTFKAENLIRYGWLTCSGGFRGSRDHTKVDLWQRCSKQTPMLSIPGYSIDTNVLLATRVGAWGEPPVVSIPDKPLPLPGVIASFPGIIRPGDDNEKVAMWTFVLAAMGYHGYVSKPFRLACKMGPGKVTTTKRFQRRHGLPGTGIVDLPTWTKAGLVLQRKRR